MADPTAETGPGLQQNPALLDGEGSPASLPAGGDVRIVGGEEAADGGSPDVQPSKDAAPDAGGTSTSPGGQQQRRMMEGGELYEQRLHAALSVPPAQRDNDVLSFLAANEALEAAAATMEAAVAAQGGAGAAASAGATTGNASGASGASSSSSSNSSEDRQLLAAAQYLVATWATATSPGLHHPRLACAHGPPDAFKHLLHMVTVPTIAFNIRFWEPTASYINPNGTANRWAAAPRLTARQLLRLLLLGNHISKGVGAPRALQFLRAVQRTLRNRQAAAQVATGLDAMAASAASDGGPTPFIPSVHQLSVACANLMCLLTLMIGTDEPPLSDAEEMQKLAAARWQMELEPGHPRSHFLLGALSRLSPAQSVNLSHTPLEAAMLEVFGLLDNKVALYRRGLQLARDGAAASPFWQARLAMHTAGDVMANAGLAAKGRWPSVPPADLPALLAEARQALRGIRAVGALPTQWTEELRAQHTWFKRQYQAVLERHLSASPDSWRLDLMGPQAGSSDAADGSEQRGRVAGPFQGYMSRCDGCGAYALETRVCGGCRVARYCSKRCQGEHWRKHKPECKAARARQAGTGPTTAAEAATTSASDSGST